MGQASETEKRHAVDVWRGGQQVVADTADQVKVHVWKDYGSLVITVTDEGNIVLDAVDGEGEVLNTACINPDEFCAVEDDTDGD